MVVLQNVMPDLNFPVPFWKRSARRKNYSELDLSMRQCQFYARTTKREGNGDRGAHTNLVLVY